MAQRKSHHKIILYLAAVSVLAIVCAPSDAAQIESSQNIKSCSSAWGDYQGAGELLPAVDEGGGIISQLEVVSGGLAGFALTVTDCKKGNRLRASEPNSEIVYGSRDATSSKIASLLADMRARYSPITISKVADGLAADESITTHVYSLSSAVNEIEQDSCPCDLFYPTDYSAMLKRLGIRRQ